MKRVVSAMLLLFSYGCSNSSSPSEPTKPATLYGQVQVCGYEPGTLTIVDASGGSASIALDSQGKFSFGYAFELGTYTAYLNYPGLAQKSVVMSGKDQMKAGVNQLYWMSLGCSTLMVAMDSASCKALYSAPITGNILGTSTSWKSRDVSLNPGFSDTVNLPESGTYQILFKGTRTDGTKWQWDYTRAVSGSYTFTMSCGTSLRGETRQVR